MTEHRLPRTVLYKQYLYPWWLDLARALEQGGRTRIVTGRLGGSENRYGRFDASALDVQHLGGMLGDRLQLNIARYLAALNGMERAIVFDPKSSFNGVLFAMCCMAKRIPYVAIVSENRTILPGGARPATAARVLLQRLGWLATRRSVGVVCESVQALEYCRAAGLTRLFLAPHGIDLQRITPAMPRADLVRQLGVDLGRPRILYLGGFYANKGFGYLLSAIERMGASDVQFLIGGGGPPPAEWKPDSRSVLELPLWPAAELSDLMALSDCLIVPSVSDAWGSERSPNVVIEGLAAGLVVLGSDCGAVPFYVGEGGFTFPERSTEGVLAAVAFVRDIRSDLPGWRRRARDVAETRFDITRYADRLAALLS